MVKPRGYPDRRGMGAQSDFLSESFVPSEEHRAGQMTRARVLLAAGISAEQVAEMLSFPMDEFPEELKAMHTDSATAVQRGERAWTGVRMWPIMIRRISICLLAAALAIFAQRTLAQGSSSQDEGPKTPSPDVSHARAIDNDAIVRMSKAGLEDAVIVQTIRSTPASFSTDPDDLIALKTAGVSGTVISAMQAKSAGLPIRPVGMQAWRVQQAATLPAAAADMPTLVHRRGGPLPIDGPPAAAGVEEIGVYYKDKDGQWVPLRTERVQYRSGGWLKSTLTHDIVKPDENGLLDGPKSPLQLPTGVEILIYAPVGTAAEEYDFLRFREHKDSREFRVKTGNVFHSETGSQRDEIEFHPVKIAGDMFTFTVPRDIEKGEYGILPPGSANQRGMVAAGKMFTFSIRE